MAIEALMFSAETIPAGPVPTRVTWATPQALEQSRPARLPVVYVVRGEVLPGLRAFTDLVVDRGRKNPHKGLAEYLLGVKPDRVPVIDGNYTATGQLRRSVAAYLARAAAAGSRALHVIGVEGALFDALWREAGGASAAAERPAGEMPDARPPAAAEASREPRERPAVRLLELLPRVAEPPDLAGTYVGDSPEARLVRQLIVYAARETDAAVLILGDTGTGKDVVARAIHAHSARAAQPFIAINCGAIPRVDGSRDPRMVGELRG